MSSVTVSLRRHASRFGSENKAYTCIQDVPQGTGAPRRCPKPAPGSRFLRILHNYLPLGPSLGIPAPSPLHLSASLSNLQPLLGSRQDKEREDLDGIKL